MFSADFTDSKALLQAAHGKWDNHGRYGTMLTVTRVELGPQIAVLKTHVDLVKDFDESTVHGLNALARKHNFLIFEDRKMIDIGSTVRKQYHRGALRITEFAHIVTLSILSGEGIVDALTQTVTAPDFPYPGERAFILLAEMSSNGNFATGEYTRKCVDLARKKPKSVISWIAMRSLTQLSPNEATEGEDFVVFTPGVNIASKGDKLGQQYQASDAISGGADFIIAGRGSYASSDPVKAAQEYRKEGWEAALRRVGRVE